LRTVHNKAFRWHKYNGNCLWFSFRISCIGRSLQAWSVFSLCRTYQLTLEMVSSISLTVSSFVRS
jgi:hypothetical protein